MKWSIPEKVIEEGRECAKEGRVVSWSKNLERRVWYAEVIGSDMLYVELDGTAKEDDVCQCMYWEQHGYCKHTVAVELAMREKGVSRFIPRTEIKEAEAPKVISPAVVFTKGFERLQDAELRKLIRQTDDLFLTYGVDIVPTSDYHEEQSVLGLHLRIGRRDTPKKTYIVKNMDEFLEAYKQDKEIRISTINWKVGPSAFNSENNALIRLMLMMKDQQTLVVNSRSQAKSVIDRRYLILNKQVARQLFDEFKHDKSFMIKGLGSQIKRAVIHQGKIPLTVTLSPVGLSDYELTIIDPFIVFLEEYQWLVGTDGFYELTEEQAASYQVLTQMLKRLDKPTIYYTKDQVNSLFSYVLPQLALLCDFDLPESLDDEVLRYPLDIKLYFHKEDDSLVVRVDFCYGEYIFSNVPNYSTSIGEEGAVLRDKVQEERLITLLRHYGYGTYAQRYSKKFPNDLERFYFFTREIPTLKKYTEVHLSEEVQSLYLAADEHQPKARIIENGSWFDIQFDISSVDETEVNDVLSSLMQNKEYHQLRNGQVLMLDDEAYKETNQMLRLLREDIRLDGNRLEVPTYRSLVLSEAMTQLTDVETSDYFETMVDELTHPETADIALPAQLNATLRDYQITGFKWFKTLSKYHFGGILADDMGLGKTIQTIAYLLSEKEEGELTKPSVIVAPASLLYNWQLELEKFAPSLKSKLIIGGKEERNAQIASLDDIDVAIISYSTLRQDSAELKKIDCHSVILDEAQMVKNSATKTFQSISELKSDRVFALSGTPIENRLEELWSLFKLLMPGFFPAIRSFKQLETTEIATMIKPFVLRRVKKDVLQDLPDKVETDRYSQLTDEQKTVYVAYLKQIQDSLSKLNAKDFNKQRMSILAGITRLRQICCHPGLFIEDYTGGSGKMDQALDLIEQAKSNGRRVLLFSQFTGMLSILEDELAKRDVGTFYLRGSTPVKERQELVERFNRGEKDVFLISLKAGGTGLNLTGADTVILYDLWWNPAVEEQATGRAHRIGQTRKVEVWRLLAEGTIEERMNQLQLEKKALFQKVLHSEDAPELSSMTMDDIKHILAIGDED
ncbi:DEAD/DEAH box helicase [Vagococcus bubulae]|uniref:Snf2 family helicase n=1 Tax=Vagococcus bubulae TaxID=1977868 RepID=A0A429ZK74_9ENTE|nr:DEAD/DEAH box helicase [Vagococcus bubulae]RST94094.1 hypothetical protein CBF36_06855 [Vagococcus bubulae]